MKRVVSKKKSISTKRITRSITKFNTDAIRAELDVKTCFINKLNYAFLSDADIRSNKITKFNDIEIRESLHLLISKRKKGIHSPLHQIVVSLRLQWCFI